MAADNFRFAESDSLLCYHGPMLYEAKCLKRRKMGDGRAQYFIHYKGWNSKWEEWVDDDRVLTVNTYNMNKMASLKEIHSNSKKSSVKRSVSIIKEETIRNTTPPVKGRKRKHSEISTESVQSVNVSSTEPKPKKRGRPPKIVMTPKFKRSARTKIIETTDIIKVTDEIKAIDVNKTTDGNKTANENKATDVIGTTEKIEKIETTEIAEVTDGIETNDAVEATDTSVSVDKAKVTDSVEENVTVKETNTIEESDAVKKIEEIEEENTANVFTVPAPVIKVIPVINIPLILKRRIAYDYIMTTKNNKILKFPVKLTVEKLIRSYLCSFSAASLTYRERGINIALTLIQYFNILIHKELLYQQEREQKLHQKAKAYLESRIVKGKIKTSEFTQIIYPKKLWHYVYGPTYLLRLFVNLPRLLLTYLYTDKQTAFIVENFECFLKFIESHYEKYFTDDDYEDFEDE